MKIIIVRHGSRFDSPLYFTPLTRKGLEEADKLVDMLKGVNPEAIYCSPFLRTLQTIYPYCVENNKTVNVENAFYECLICDEFNYHNYRHTPKELELTYPHLKRIINDSYKSQLFISNISYVETYKDIQNRVYPFIHKLCQTYKNTNKIFIIVTHATILNTIKKYFDKNVDYLSYVQEAKPYCIDVPSDIKGPHE